MSITSDALRMVKMRMGGEAPLLLAWRTVPLPEGIPLESTSYGEFICDALRSFSRGDGNVEVRVVMHDVDAQVRNLRVPDVQGEMLNEVVYWSFKKDADIDDRTDIFDYERTDLDEGETSEEGRIPIVAYAAPREPVLRIRTVLSRAGFRVKGVTFPFFAARNLFLSGWLTSAETPVAFFHIARDSARITVYYGRAMPFTRGIKFGADSFVSAIQEQAGGDLTFEQARRVLYSLGFDNPPLREDDAGYGIDADEIMRMIDSTIQRMARQIERTLQYCSSEMNLDNISEIYVSGDLSSCEMLVFALRELVGRDLFLINPFEGHELDLDDSPPVSISERAFYASAIGTALWDETHTLNLLHTCRDKERMKRTARTNAWVLAAFAVFTFVMGFFHYALHQRVQQAQRIRAGLNEELRQFVPLLTLDDARREVERTRQKAMALRTYTTRLYLLGVLSDLSGQLPSDIQVTRLRLERGATSASDAGAARSAGNMRIEGYIEGVDERLPSILAAYMARLEGSPFFTSVETTGSVKGQAPEGSARMYFGISATMVGAPSGGGGR